MAQSQQLELGLHNVKENTDHFKLSLQWMCLSKKEIKNELINMKHQSLFCCNFLCFLTNNLRNEFPSVLVLVSVAYF